MKEEEDAGVEERAEEGGQRLGQVRRPEPLHVCISPLRAAQMSTLPFRDRSALGTFWENLTKRYFETP